MNSLPASANCNLFSERTAQGLTVLRVAASLIVANRPVSHTFLGEDTLRSRSGIQDALHTLRAEGLLAETRTAKTKRLPGRPPHNVMANEVLTSLTESNPLLRHHVELHELAREYGMTHERVLVKAVHGLYEASQISSLS